MPTEFAPLAADYYGFESDLAPKELEFLGNLRERLERDVAPGVNEHWEKATFPSELPKVLAEQRACGLSFEETRPFENSAVFRGWVALELGRVDASVATYVGVQNGLAMGSIGLCGSAEQRQRWLPAMAEAELIGSFGLTEPLSGSDASKGLRSRARREGDEYVISGEKRWIGNATFGDVTVIWAVDEADHQVKGFVVPNDSEGFSVEKIERKMALRIVQNGHITMNEVRIPADHKLEDANSFRDTARVLRMTRAEVAWLGAGIAVGAYEAALAYSKERLQFGAPIARRQLVQDHLVTSLSKVTAAIAMCQRVSELQDRDELTDERSALAKATVTTLMRETVAHCREVVGGNGIVTDYGVGRFFADAEAIYSYEGTKEMNTLIVGRDITGIAAFV